MDDGDGKDMGLYPRTGERRGCKQCMGMEIRKCMLETREKGGRAWKVGKSWISSHTDRMVRKHRHGETLGSKFVQCWHHWTCFIRQHKTMGNHQPLEYPLVNIHSLLLKMAQSLLDLSIVFGKRFFRYLPGIFCRSVEVRLWTICANWWRILLRSAEIGRKSASKR